MVPLTGIEPVFPASEADALSVELQRQTLQGYFTTALPKLFKIPLFHSLFWSLN